MPGTPLCWYDLPATRHDPHNGAAGQPSRLNVPVHLFQLEGGRRSRDLRGRSPSNHLRATTLIRDAGPPEADQKAGARGRQAGNAAPTLKCDVFVFFGMVDLRALCDATLRWLRWNPCPSASSAGNSRCAMKSALSAVSPSAMTGDGICVYLCDLWAAMRWCDGIRVHPRNPRPICAGATSAMERWTVNC